MWKTLESLPGSAVFFSSYLPHRTADNITSTSRRAYYLTFSSSNDGKTREEYYIERRRLFPPECDRVPGKDYSEGARIYFSASPLL